MTTIDAAAARRASSRVALGLSIVLTAGFLAGCGSSSNLLNGDQTAFTPPPAEPSAATQPVTTGRRVALTPVIGAPEQIAQQIAQALGTSAGRQNVVIVGASEPAEFTLRGYVVAAAERTGTKVSYIWDVSSPTGQRVNRITGEETISGAAAKDPWGAVSANVVQAIADKTAGSLSTWLTSQPASAPQAVPMAANPATPSAVGVAAAQPTPTLAPQPLPSAAPAAPSQATASLPKAGPVSAFVPKVVGAPGDGSTTLSRALQQELQANGIALAPQPLPGTHKVEGKVAMGPAKDGQQTIKIDWVLTKPDGTFGGQVTQNNAIPAGSLDGSWGTNANEAAKAAAKGLVDLIAKPSATN